ncbi:MAG: replicative DNA helicase, partial [Lysobacter sp.]
MNAQFRAGPYHDEHETLRIPPQSVDAEQAVLGGLMLAPNALWKVLDLLTSADFYRRDHQLIFQAIRELAEKNKPFDAVTLGEWFESMGLAEQVAGGAYLIELASTTPSAANIVAYAEIVAAKALQRRLIDAGTQIVAAGFDPQGQDVAELLADAQSRIVELQPKQRGGLQNLADSLGDWYEDLQRRYAAGSRMTGLETPWCELNMATHGLQSGELTLIAARPSMGKSVMGLNLASFSALRGKRVAFFSLEMTKQQCHRRNIAALGNIPHDWLLAPHDGEDHWGGMASAIRQLKGTKLFVDDTSDLTIAQVMARARMLHLQAPLDLIVVDHVHDFKINAKEARFEYGKIAQGLKTLAKEFNCPAVALAQLNRNVTGRVDKTPNLADLRESGELEQKGDLILFLHRDDYYDANAMPGVVKVILA